MKMICRTITTLAVFTAVTILASLPSGPADAQESRLDRILQQNELRVGTTGDFNPMSFRNTKTKQLEGHNIDAAKTLAKDMGVEIEFVITDWKTLINGVVADKYDIVMTGTSMNVARAKTAGFTIPWGKNAFFPLMRKEDVGKYKSWDDLNKPSVTAAFNMGTTMETFVKNNLQKVTVRRVESPARDWQELLAGRVDFVVSSMIEGSKLSKTHPNLTLTLLDQPENSIPMSFVVPRDDQIWINFVNNWIVIRRENGYFDELNKKWGITGQ